MSAQYLVSLNDTELVQVLSAGGAEGATSDPEASSKQRDALYYIVAVISFYALTFLVLLVKYARFKKKEEESFAYFPLPPDAKMAADALGARVSDECETDEVLGAKRGKLFHSYGSGGVTAKTMRVKLSPMWPFKDDTASACDV